MHFAYTLERRKSMETYGQFMDRICSFEKPEFQIAGDYFNPSKSVLVKVAEDNSFQKFYGDTVVFDLTMDEKLKIDEIIFSLYLHASKCFCKKLNFSTLHMTLHDLSNSSDRFKALQYMSKNEAQLIKVLASKKKYIQNIRMRTNFILNMVNTSVVLALYPVNADEYSKLMYWYKIIDEVVALPYPFTPHITLAYYNRNGFGKEEIKNLTLLVNELNKRSFEITLDTRNLVYQRFTSMDNYHTAFRLI